MNIRNAIGTVGAVAVVAGLIVWRFTEEGPVLVGGVSLLLVGAFACIWAWGQPKSLRVTSNVRPSRHTPWDDGEH